MLLSSITKKFTHIFKIVVTYVSLELSLKSLSYILLLLSLTILILLVSLLF